VPAQEGDPGFWPTGVAFWNAQHGVIVGGLAKGLRGCGSCRGEIALTTDGGRSWKRVSVFTNLRPIQVAAGPAGFAWMTAVNCPPCSLALFRTTDGGRHWHRLPRANVRSPSFADAENGWAIPTTRATRGSHALIARTTDGGSTWHTVRVGCPRGVEDPVTLSFPTPIRGWVLCAGRSGAGSQDKAVLETTDAGRTWHVLAEALPLAGSSTAPSGGLTGGGYPQGMTFQPMGAGWLFGSRMAAFRTFDGGRTWNSTHLGTTVGDVQPIAIAFPDPRLGFSLVHNGNLQTVGLLSTSDGGARWSIVRSWPSRP
jgi:photosystem II stability/assembly factor-like uncharacterized protein